MAVRMRLRSERESRWRRGRGHKQDGEEGGRDDGNDDDGADEDKPKRERLIVCLRQGSHQYPLIICTALTVVFLFCSQYSFVSVKLRPATSLNPSLPKRSAH